MLHSRICLLESPGSSYVCKYIYRIGPKSHRGRDSSKLKLFCQQEQILKNFLCFSLHFGEKPSVWPMCFKHQSIHRERANMHSPDIACTTAFDQGILKGEVSLYHWPPVWLVWNQLYDNRQFLFLFAKQTYLNQSNRRSMVQWYFPPP